MPPQLLSYPFFPKSTKALRRGQFWAIPLESGGFGAGCVVGHHTKEGKVSSRMFIAGVVQWFGKEIPLPAELKGLPLVEYAFAHLKVITESGGMVLGETALHFAGAPENAESLSLKTWGYGIPKLLAQRFAKNVG